MKLYFMHYSCVVIILFGTGLHKSVFSAYFFGKLGFCLSVFWFFMFLYLWFLALIFLFNVLNWMSFLIMSDLITFFSFLLTLFRPLFTTLDGFSQSHVCLFPENFLKTIKKALYVTILDM